MQLPLRRSAATGLAVVSAGLLGVMGGVAPDVEQDVAQQRAVELVATSEAIDLASLLVATADVGSMARTAPVVVSPVSFGGASSASTTLSGELSHWLTVFAPDASKFGFPTLASDMQTWASDLLSNTTYQTDLSNFLGAQLSAQLVAFLNPSTSPLQSLADALSSPATLMADLQQVPADLAAALASLTAALHPATAAAGLTVALDAGNLAGLLNPADLTAMFGPALAPVADIPAVLMSLMP